MKISKKDLKRIILENILSEQEVSTQGAGATRVRRGSSRRDVLPKIEQIVKKAVESNEDLEEAIIKVGKNAITFSGVIVKDGANKEEVKKEIRKAINDAEGIDDLRSKLRTGRSYKVVIKRSGEVQGTEVADSDGDQTRSNTSTGGDEPESPTPPGIYKYEDDDPYEYRVNQQTGCWEAKKPGGNWFSMKRYPDNMKNLDDKFPRARSQALRDKCAGSSRPSSPRSSSSATGKLGETISRMVAGDMLGVTTSSRVGNGALANDDGEQVAFVGSSGFDMIYEDLGGGSLDGVDSGYVIVQKEKSGQPGPDNKTLAAAVFYITDSGVKGVFVDQNLRKSGTISDDSFTTADFDSQGSPAGLGIDATVIQKILDRLKRFKQGSLSESLSRGSLLRRRYWGRY